MLLDIKRDHPASCECGLALKKTHPSINQNSEHFELDKETKTTMRSAEEAENRRPLVGTVYVDKYELPKPFRREFA